jgi:hypothetical protein
MGWVSDLRPIYASICVKIFTKTASPTPRHRIADVLMMNSTQRGPKSPPLKTEMQVSRTRLNRQLPTTIPRADSDKPHNTILRTGSSDCWLLTCLIILESANSVSGRTKIRNQCRKMVGLDDSTVPYEKPFARLTLSELLGILTEADHLSFSRSPRVTIPVSWLILMIQSGSLTVNESLKAEQRLSLSARIYGNPYEFL